MAHTFTNCLIHAVFSTKGRRPLIAPAIQDRVWAYMGGIARENNMHALAVGGTEDHAHMLITLPSTVTIAKALQIVKGGSSKWIHETFPTHADFAWQDGYGAFSIGVSQRDDTIRYIQNQPQHHRELTFKDEFRAILKKHGIEYDERYIWG